MKFVGLDLGGVNSLACVRNHVGTESFQGSAHPERPSCVLLPLVRKERLLAGDESLQNERGLGLPWPPLAMAVQDGWSRVIPPTPGGRLLLATVWQRLVAGGQWQDPQWQPPDGLPALNKPTPAECLTAEARSALKQTRCDAANSHVVLAIPNQLHEESQELLLGRLPAGTRLVWRSVAAAMSWAEKNTVHNGKSENLAVLDAGMHGFEISVFEFRQQESDGRVFRVPVRRLNRLSFANTGTLLADTPAPFARLLPDLAELEPHMSKISNLVGGQLEWLLCGPLADPLFVQLQRRFPSFNWTAPDAAAVARGSCLFAWRLAQGLPTYLDVLPSLELFTLTEEHEPNWLSLIPEDCEVSGGRDFETTIPRRIFIEAGTTRLASWLQRSSETEFRKLSTDLPVEAAKNAWVDLNVSLRSAGGFARVGISPSLGQFDVFGTGQSLMLNWQSMERVARGPQEKWPVTMKYGWPKCGKLYAYRQFFNEFLNSATDLQSIFNLSDVHQRLNRLGSLKNCIRQTISPLLAGVTGTAGAAAPVNQLVCFSSDAPCEFIEGTQLLTPPQSKEERMHKIAQLLLERFKVLKARAPTDSTEIKAIVYILGRMAGYAPDEFRNHLAADLRPKTSAVRLFAAGRVLHSASHGLRLFETIANMEMADQALNNNWLRMLVYVLYQRADVLKDVPREHLVACVSLCVDVFGQQVRAGNVRILFMNSLRALALLLRARRHAQARDFLCLDKCPTDESSLAAKLSQHLHRANSLRLRPGAKTLVALVTKWLDFVASTDEMPPIAPPDEEDEAGDTNDD